MKASGQPSSSHRAENRTDAGPNPVSIGSMPEHTALVAHVPVGTSSQDGCASLTNCGPSLLYECDLVRRAGEIALTR